MSRYIKYLFIAAFVTFGLLTPSAFAQDASFRRVQLAYGISLDVPSHWTELSLEDRKNIAAAGQAMSDNSGIKVLSGKENLLAINATPKPTGAMIRVSVTSSPGATQSALAEITSTDLEEIGVEFLSMFRQAEAVGGPRIIEMQSVRFENLNNYTAIVIPYVEAGVGLNERSPWQVTQYKIPVSNRLIEVTLSHRQSDAGVWIPILERVKRSIKF